MSATLLTTLLVGLSGEIADTGEAAMLVRGARDMLREGRVSQAFVQLRRARALDSVQVGIDQLMMQCRIQMGEWVPPDASTRGEWVEVDDLGLDTVPVEQFDSLLAAGRRSEGKGDLATALRIYGHLAGKRPGDSTFSNSYSRTMRRQDELVSRHRQDAEEHMRRGRLEAALGEYRLALHARPDNALLKLKVREAEDAVSNSIAGYRAAIARCLAGGDLECALGVASRAQESHPSDSGFRRQHDELASQKRSEFEVRLRGLEALVDSGQDVRALDELMQAMVRYKDDPVLMQLFEEFRARLDRKRQNRDVDALAKSFEAAMARGDASRAQSLLASMRLKSASPADLERRSARVDSLKTVQRNAVAVVDEEMARARKALAVGDVKAAKAALDQALAKNPGHVVAKSLLAGIAAPLSTAPPVARSLGSAEARRVDGLLVAGISSYRSGDYQTAAARWNEVLRIDPANAEARKYLDNVRQKLARLK